MNAIYKTALAGLSAPYSVWRISGPRALLFVLALVALSQSALAANFAGSYSGTFTGADSGTWSATITTSGTVSGTGHSNALGASFAVTGQVTTSGTLTMGSVTVGSTFTGTINSTTGYTSGTWSDGTAGGNFSGTGNITPAPATDPVSSTPVSNARVFAYAEANYPGIFPGAATAGQYQQYDYRHYTASGNYLAVDTSGMIFILGPYTGNMITPVGTVASLANIITAWEATLTPIVPVVSPTCTSPQVLQSGVCVSPTMVVALASHMNDTKFGITANGDLWGWGNNHSGSLGNGTENDATYGFLSLGSGFSSVSSVLGGTGTYAIKNDGTLWAWGLNTSGELGTGTNTNYLIPTQIGSGITSVYPAYGCSYALKNDQTLWAWGRSCQSTRYTTPIQIGSGFVSAAASPYGVMAIKSDGGLWAWGNNDSRWQAAGTSQYPYSFSAFTQIGSNYKSVISTGTNTTIGLKVDGSLWTWGQSSNGALGDGVTAAGYRGFPQQIGTDYIAISAGHNHALALKSDGSLWAWGHLSASNTAADSTVPKKIGTGFAKIYAGAWTDYAISSDGGLWAWGDNFDWGFNPYITPYAATPQRIAQ